jgi:hypothetical protein
MSAMDCTKLNVINYLVGMDYPHEDAEETVEIYSHLIDEGIEDGLSAETVGADILQMDMEACDALSKGESNGEA